MAPADQTTNTTPKILPRPTNPLIRISFFFTKHPSMTQSEFETHWRDTHGRLAITSTVFTAANIQGYVQVHNNMPLTKELGELGITPMTDFSWDACSEIYVQRWEDYLAFAKSDEARDVLGPDGAKMMHPGKGVRVTVATVDPMFTKSV
jgi:hypothetical protein